MRLLVVLLPILAFALAPAPWHTDAATGSQAPARRIITTITSHGLRVSLTIPRHEYPQDALVWVTASIKNISRKPKALTGLCGRYPRVEVSDDAGDVLDPPTLPNIVTLKGCRGDAVGGGSPTLSAPAMRIGEDNPLCSPFLDHHRANTCLPATDVRKAERLVPFAINPTSLVWREAHLRLTGVVLSGPTAHPFGISYLYGHIPRSETFPVDYRLSRPQFADVYEVAGRWGAAHSAPEIGLLTPPATWQFGALFPRRGWALNLTSNLSKPVVSRIGWAIVRAARSGK